MLKILIQKVKTQDSIKFNKREITDKGLETDLINLEILMIKTNNKVNSRRKVYKKLPNTKETLEN
jgi:hypothetical protein